MNDTRWTDVDFSQINISVLSDEDLLSLYRYAKSRTYKPASHLIRLLRMGIEFLKDGELQVMRSDAQQLLEIKRGEWTLDRVQREADDLFKLAQEAYVRSTLPEKPDMEKINALCVDVVKTAWKERA